MSLLNTIARYILTKGTQYVADPVLFILCFEHCRHPDPLRYQLFPTAFPHRPHVRHLLPRRRSLEASLLQDHEHLGSTRRPLHWRYMLCPRSHPHGELQQRESLLCRADLLLHRLQQHRLLNDCLYRRHIQAQESRLLHRLCCLAIPHHHLDLWVRGQ